MTTFVVDASVAAKWFFPEEHSTESRRLLSRRHTLIAPDLIWSELANIVWKRVRRRELEPHEATKLITDIIRLPLQIAPTQPLVAPALELAVATDRTVYDCLYLATALARNCRLVTADDRFVNALVSTPFSKHIRHVTKLR
jgi:predicted nucleic acid-binding protein